MPYALAFSIFAATTLLSGFVALLAKEDPIMSGLIVLVILVIGLRLVFQILPPWVRSAAGEVAHFFLRLVLGTGHKGGART